MTRLSKEAWNERREAFERFADRLPPPSEKELASRLSWLQDVLALAHDLGGMEPLPIDSPEIRERRKRIRAGLARLSV